MNVEALRLRVKQFERVFGFPAEDPADIGLQLDAMTRSLRDTGINATVGQGVPPDFPIDVEIPEFYYLYVAPTQ